MSITISPKWKMWIGVQLGFLPGIIFTALGLMSLFFGDSDTFTMISLTFGIILLIFGIIIIRKNFEKRMNDPSF